MSKKNIKPKLPAGGRKREQIVPKDQESFSKDCWKAVNERNQSWGGNGRQVKKIGLVEGGEKGGAGPTVLRVFGARNAYYSRAQNQR